MIDMPEHIILPEDHFKAVHEALARARKLMDDYRKAARIRPEIMNKPMDAAIRLQERRRYK